MTNQEPALIFAKTIHQARKRRGWSQLDPSGAIRPLTAHSGPYRDWKIREHFESHQDRQSIGLVCLDGTTRKQLETPPEAAPDFSTREVAGVV